MKYKSPIVFLAALLLSCNCGDDAPNDFEPSALEGRWKLSQKVFEGNVQNNFQNIAIVFTNNGTYTKLDDAVVSCAGTYTLEGSSLTMASDDCENHIAHVPMLTFSTLALQLHYDADGDGDREPVRETYTR